MKKTKIVFIYTMFYVLIGISLTFTGIAAMQFLYLAYLERVESEHKNRIRELERYCKKLSKRLVTAEIEITEQKKLIGRRQDNEEVWADLIADR